MRKIISFIIIGFILVWSYNLFINSFIILEEVEEEPYKGIIKIWDIPRPDINTGNNYGWLQDKIQSFEKKNPGVYIELTPMKEDELYDNIEDNKDIEEIPDIIPVDPKFPDFKILEPLDDFFLKDELEEFKHQVLKSINYNNQMVSVPIGMSTYVMYLNLDIFNEKGVSPPLNGSWTYEEFVDILKQLTCDSTEGGITEEYGFISPIGPGYYNAWGIILSDSGEFINNKRLKYNFYGEKAIKGLERTVDLKYKYNVTPDYFGIIDEKDTWEMFYKDQSIGVYPDGSWKVNSLEKQYKNEDGFNFDVANYPTGDKDLPVVLNNGIFSYGVIKDDNPKKTELCVKFLKSLTTDSSQSSLEDIGLFTVKRGINNMYIDNPKMKRIEESLSYTRDIPFIDNYLEIDYIIQEEVRKAILKEKSSYEAIEDAKIEIDKLGQ